MMKWVDQTKEYTDKGYNNKSSLWDSQWAADQGPTGKVFGFFYSTWGINFTLLGNSLATPVADGEKPQVGNGIYGDYAVCEGPQPYYWGGTWICGAAGSDNIELIRDVMQKLTCDEAIMKQITLDTEDYTNNELWSIFMNRLAHKKMNLADAELCRSLADSYFDGERRSLGVEFSNARKANQLFNIVSENYDIREFEEGVTDLTIRPQDFPNFDSSKHNMASNNLDTEAIYETAEVAGKTKPASSLQIDLSQEPGERRASDVSHFAKAVGLIVNSKGMGTAFVISAKANLIITAYHVIEGISDSTFYLERGTVVSPAKLLWADPVIDMAILEVEKLPEDIHYFAIDHNSASTPALLEPIIHCGFVKGISVSDNFQVYEGKISGYDLQKQVNESTRFDAILSDIAAINGCSGGPVVRTSDMSVIGVLQGGFGGVPTRIITDIHQLHKNKNLTIII